MTTTLFGGAILIALLYFSLRLAGVSNYWRGVVSGALPTLGFLFYSLGFYGQARWPGGDVMAAHIAVYVATATALTLTGNRQPGESRRVHWIPKIIIGFFLLLALLMAGFVTIATHGLPPAIASLVLPNAADKKIYTGFSGEVPHDEAAAKTVSRYMQKSLRQRQLGWQIEVDGLDQLRLNQAAKITVSAHDGAQQPITGASVKLSIKRPGDSTAKTVVLSAVAPGRYLAQLDMDQPGLWVAVLQVERGQDQFETAKEVIIPVLQ